MSRVQVALNVGDLDASIEFYSKLFRTPPAKVREGYANFAITEPPLKLVLIAGQGEPGTLNHIGVEVESTDEVAEAASRMNGELEESTTCCYAVQDKVWVSGPRSHGRSTPSSPTPPPWHQSPASAAPRRLPSRLPSAHGPTPAADPERLLLNGVRRPRRALHR